LNIQTKKAETEPTDILNTNKKTEKVDEVVKDTQAKSKNEVKNKSEENESMSDKEPAE
jgi:hypothetical protein